MPVKNHDVYHNLYNYMLFNLGLPSSQLTNETAVKAKIEEFGGVAVWVDAHKLDEMRAAVRTPHRGKPLIILANSSPFRGMPVLQLRFPRLHYVRFKSEQERAKLNTSIAKSLGVDPIDYEGAH